METLIFLIIFFQMHNRMTKMQVERKTLNSEPVATNSEFMASEVSVWRTSPSPLR